MKRIKRMLAGLLAGFFMIGNASMESQAAKIQVDQQIPAEEVDGVYNQQVDSNLLEGWPQGPQLYSESGIVMDMDSGAILYAKKIDDQHYPASITKILTALVALENSQLTDRVVFTQDCIDFLEYGDAHIGMKVGEEISMEDALYGMLLASANEVSYAIANSSAGGYESFLNQMNEKVAQLGGTNSHFMNANGLHDAEHYTSARDMALIGSEVFQHEEFRKITATRQHTIGATAITDETRTFQQNHKMLFKNNRNYYEYCVGGKTGFTDQALTTLVTFATKDDKNLVAVTLRVHGGGQNSYKDTRAMLDYAFDQFAKVPITKNEVRDKRVEQVAEGGYVMLPANVKVDQLSVKLVDPTELGDRQGTLVYTYKDQPVGKVPVTISEKYYNQIHDIKEEKPDKEKPSKENEKPKKKLPAWVKITGGIIGGVVIVIVVLEVVLECVRRRMIAKRRAARKRRRRRKNDFS